MGTCMLTGICPARLVNNDATTGVCADTCLAPSLFTSAGLSIMYLMNAASQPAHRHASAGTTTSSRNRNRRCIHGRAEAAVPTHPFAPKRTHTAVGLNYRRLVLTPPARQPGHSPSTTARPVLFGRTGAFLSRLPHSSVSRRCRYGLEPKPPVAQTDTQYKM